MTDLNGDLVNVFTGSPQNFKLSIPVAPTPVMMVGPSRAGTAQLCHHPGRGGGRNHLQCFAHRGSGFGEADAIEVSSNTVSARIPLGKCPVYAVQSPDTKRLFVLNRGSDTVTVINSQNNTLNACTPFQSQTGRTVTCHPTLPLSTTAGLVDPNAPAVAGPVYAEYNSATNQLIVANYDGSTINVIDVSLDEFGNDGPNFGTTFTIPVGRNPASVTMLYDGSRAYTADQTDQTVTVVNLVSHTVLKAVPVTGHPQNSAFDPEFVVRESVCGLAGQPVSHHSPYRPGHRGRNGAGAREHPGCAHDHAKCGEREPEHDQPQAGFRTTLLSAGSRGHRILRDLRDSAHACTVIRHMPVHDTRGSFRMRNDPFLMPPNRKLKHR